MNFFTELGVLVNKLWKEKNYDQHRFPAVAMQALSELPPAENVSFREGVFLGLADPLPVQSDMAAQFGQPPLTVYSAEEFRIELLFWLHALPSIHQHGFSGAFHVMHGNTLQTGWQFHQRERIATGLLLGDVKINEVELLRQGETRPIIAGSKLIHTTYHLRQPTVSVVVRTMHENDVLPQYTYLPPSVAFDPEAQRPSSVRHEQLLLMLLKLGRIDECLNAIQSLIAESDAVSAFHFLLWANANLKDGNVIHEITAGARVKHPLLVEELAPALAWQRREIRLENIKNTITDQDLQFFLGVLLNVPDRALAMSILQQQYPSFDPVDMAMNFIGSLSKLGVLGFRLNDTWRFVLSCFMRGISGLDEIEKLLAARYGVAAVVNQRSQIRDLAGMLHKFWLFEPYFLPLSGADWVDEGRAERPSEPALAV
jgi:hypothetical protein